MTLSQTIRCATAFAVLAILALPVPAASAPMSSVKPSFDGNWSVLIVTEKGTCDRAYRYPVKIEKGSVGYAGSASFTVTSKVGEKGAVTVTVARGSQSATGRGTLSHSDGSGRWAAASGDCSGTWTAERRSRLRRSSGISIAWFWRSPPSITRYVKTRSMTSPQTARLCAEAVTKWNKLMERGATRQLPRTPVAGLADVDRVAELAPARLPDRQRGLRPLRDQPPFLSQCGVEVQHKRIGVPAEFEKPAVRRSGGRSKRPRRGSFASIQPFGGEMNREAHAHRHRLQQGRRRAFLDAASRHVLENHLQPLLGLVRLIERGRIFAR